MSKILVTYSTNSGSTAEVADEIARVFTQNGHVTDVKRITDVNSLDGYETVVVGAPMIFGWHSVARRFITRNQAELSTKKVVSFACAMRLTQVPTENLPVIPLSLDPSLAASPKTPGKLSLKERFTSLGYYLNPMLKAASEIRPLNVAFFNGKLDLFKLKWWQAAFVMVVVQGVPGDYRDWDYIKNWSAEISKQI